MDAHEDPRPGSATTCGDSVADETGGSVWTVGQLRVALADLADDLPLLVRAAAYEDYEDKDSAEPVVLVWGDNGPELGAVRPDPFPFVIRPVPFK